MKYSPLPLALPWLCLLVCSTVFAQDKPGPPQDSSGPREITIRSGPYKPPSATFAVESNLVELRVTVRDPKGHTVSGLTASDFEVLDDGKPRHPAFFSEEKSADFYAAHSTPSDGSASHPESPATSARESAEPQRSIALFIDDSHGGMNALERSKRAAAKFISSGMRAADRVALFTDSGAITVDFTSDREALLAALHRLIWRTQLGYHPFSIWPSITAYQAYVIANSLDSKAKEAAVAQAVESNCGSPDKTACTRDQENFIQDLAISVWAQLRYESSTALAVLRIAVQRLAAEPGERILVMLSPGFPTGDMPKEVSAILDTALRARIVINSIDSEGIVTPDEYPEGNRVDYAVRQLVLPELMSSAAAATGGQFITNNNDILGSIDIITSVPAESYLIGFEPTTHPDEQFHTLKVRLTMAGDYKVQARTGYFYSARENEGSGAQQRMNHEAFSHDQISQIPVAIRVLPGAAGTGPPKILVTISVDAGRLKFAQRDGRHVQQLTFLTLLEDCMGNLIAGKEAVMDLYLKPDTLAKLKAEGLHATLTFPAPKAPYQVREVVREVVQDHMATANASTDCR